MFLAGESLEQARSQPNGEDLERQEAEQVYWWSGLPWWIRCDSCGVITPYHRPTTPFPNAEERAGEEYGYIAWEAHGGGGHVCAGGCMGQQPLVVERQGAWRKGW